MGSSQKDGVIIPPSSSCLCFCPCKSLAAQWSALVSGWGPEAGGSNTVGEAVLAGVEVTGQGGVVASEPRGRKKKALWGPGCG